MKLAGMALVLLALFVPGCSRPDRPAAGDSAPAGGPPVSGDWVIVQSDSDAEILNPILSTTATPSRIQYGINESNIFESLLQYNTQDWTFTKPLLAESYPQISDDHLTYTFILRDGIKWHDGAPLSVDDLLFSMKVVMFPLVDAAEKRGYFAEMTDVQIMPPRTIQFTFAKPNFLNVVFLGGNTFPIIPRHIFDPQGLLDHLTFKDMIAAKARADAKAKEFAALFSKHPANRAPVGTGPYKFERWDTGKEIVLARNEDYWGQKPYLDKVVYRIIQDRTASLTALKAGDVDVIPRLLPIQYAQQTSGPQFESQFVKETYPTTQYSFIVWNSERPFFKDKRVRQALTMLVDRKQIIETLRFGLGQQTESHFNPNSPVYNTDLKPYPYDPVHASQLLDEAGWKDTDGDGVRDKDGVPFRFEFLGAASSVFTDQLLPVLREEFRKIGIDMKERRIEFTVMVENLRDRRFDASTLLWVSPLIGDPYQIWHSRSITNRGSNYANFRNAESDALIEKARTEFDPAKRKQLYWRWQEIIYEEQPYTFLYVPKDPLAYAKRFQNVKLYPPDPAFNILEWFVPARLQKHLASPAN